MKCIYIYNPKSGRGNINKKVAYIEKRLKEKFDQVIIYETKSQADAIHKARESCLLYDALIFSGGDGTFNDMISGICSSKKRPILGYIPSGTVNDIARNLNIPRNVKKALDIIIEGNVIKHDVGRINGDQYFMYVCGIGTFTGVSYRVKHQYKKFFGRLAYGFDGIKEFFKPTLSIISIKAKGEIITINTPLLLIVNSISVAGIPINSSGHLNDGMFDILVVNKGPHKGVFNIIKLFVMGLLGMKKKNYLKTYRLDKFEVNVNGDYHWSVDGEYGPMGSIAIENLHNHLEIFVPKK